MVTPAVKLLRPLGAGGMGAVWVAEHTGLKTEVVVKFMAVSDEDRAEATERFAREAALSAAVKSPHVVQVFDHGTTPDGLLYIAESGASFPLAPARLACGNQIPMPGAFRLTGGDAVVCVSFSEAGPVSRETLRHLGPDDRAPGRTCRRLRRTR